MDYGIKPPEWPTPNPEIEAAVGRFIIAWNVLEREIDRAVEDITRLDWQLAWSVTANLGIKGKLDLVQSLAASLRDYFGGGAFSEEVMKFVEKLAADTGNASGNSRNLIVHGQPMLFDHPTQGRMEIWAKMAARKGGIKGTMWLWSAESIDEHTAGVRSLVERWNKARELMAPDLYELMMWEKTEGPRPRYWTPPDDEEPE